MGILLIRHAVKFAFVAKFPCPICKVFRACVINQAVMFALNEQHRDVILSHQRHRLAVSSVIIAPEELVQQQLYCQTLIISKTIGSAGADEACDI